MQTNKDFILRSIQRFSELLDALFKKEGKKEEIIVVINDFMLNEFHIPFHGFLEKSFDEITAILISKNYNTEEIKELSNIFYIKFKIEEVKIIKKEIAKKAINLYNYYDVKSKIFSLENHAKTQELLTFIKNN